MCLMYVCTYVCTHPLPYADTNTYSTLKRDQGHSLYLQPTWGRNKKKWKRQSTPKKLLYNDASTLRISRLHLLASERGREYTHRILLLCSLHLGADGNVIICSGPGVSESNLNPYLARLLLPPVRGGQQRSDRDSGGRLSPRYLLWCWCCWGAVAGQRYWRSDPLHRSRRGFSP